MERSCTGCASPRHSSRAGGWGGAKLELLKQMSRQLIAQGPAQVALQHWPPPAIDPVWRTVWESRSARLQEGIFATPCEETLKRVLPLESQTARVRLLSPRNAPSHQTSCVLHLAGTGDHGFDRRMRLGAPLLEKNIATMVLESPYYGKRRPPLQRGARLLCVSDLLVLGRTTVEEARSLLHWLATVEGHKKLGIYGLSMERPYDVLIIFVRTPVFNVLETNGWLKMYSMGVFDATRGVHAAMVGSLHRSPVAILPFLTPHSAAVAFCEGILRYGTAWEVLMRDELLNGSMTREQVFERMRTVLALTDVTQFPAPEHPKSVIFVAATDDGYVPDHSGLKLQAAWPGSEVRWVRGGHVSSFILHKNPFRKAIQGGLDRLS